MHAAGTTTGTRMHTVVMPVSGRRVTVDAGDTVEVQLRQLGGSGAVWQVEGAPAQLVFERDDHIGAGVHRVGAFSTRLLRFRAVGAGTGLLQLVLGRPDDLEPCGRLDVHVTVREG